MRTRKVPLLLITERNAARDGWHLVDSDGPPDERREYEGMKESARYVKIVEWSEAWAVRTAQLGAGRSHGRILLPAKLPVSTTQPLFTKSVAICTTSASDRVPTWTRKTSSRSVRYH